MRRRLSNRFLLGMARSAVALALGLAFFGNGRAMAGPQRLRCSLASETADGQGATRKLTIVFDDAAKTLVVDEGAGSQKLENVTISTVSINGAGADMTIGIDRSSGSIVLQTYRPDGVSNMFGLCVAGASPGP